jgi:hypothetical protein
MSMTMRQKKCRDVEWNNHDTPQIERTIHLVLLETLDQ